MTERPLLGEQRIRVLARVGELILHWNRLEASARIVANEAAGGSEITFAFMNGLTASALAQWLFLLADANDGTDAYKDHLRYCAKLFDRLRTYRNHYVHGLSLLIERPTGAQAIISTSMRQGARFKSETEFFEENDLIPVCNAIIEAESYVAWVALAHDGKGQPRAGAEGLTVVARPNLLAERKPQNVHDWFPRRDTP